MKLAFPGPTTVFLASAQTAGSCPADPGNSASLVLSEASNELARMGALGVPPLRVAVPPVSSNGRSLGIDGLTLGQIHEGGLQESARALREFEPFRRCKGGEREWILRLWEEHNRFVSGVIVGQRSKWKGYPEYIDSADPIRLDRDVMEVEELKLFPAADFERLIRLHMRIRASLALERVATIPISSGETRYRYLHPDGIFPIRDETLLMPRVAPHEIVRILAFLHQVGDVGNPLRADNLQKVSREISFLHAQAPSIFADLLSALEVGNGGGVSADRVRALRRAIRWANLFVRLCRGKIDWEGPAFSFFFDTALADRDLAAFWARLRRNNLRQVVFTEGGVNFGVREARRQARWDGVTYSYREATAVNFLSNPLNGWGGEDLTLDLAPLRQRIRQFFDREKIQPEYFDYIYRIRNGLVLMSPAELSDESLARAGLDAAGREEIRHLEALLSLAKDLRHAPRRGPYGREGLLIRYCRLLHRVPLDAPRVRLTREFGFTGYSDIELGRVAVTDRGVLLAVAAEIGVPRIYEAALVDHLIGSYREADARLVSAGSALKGLRRKVREFPNPEWTIPYEDLSVEELNDRIKSLARRLRGSLLRAQFARRHGLTENQIRVVEDQGLVPPSTLAAYLRIFGGKKPDAKGREFRLLIAARDFQIYPLEERGGFVEAGRLLRFTRLLVDGGLSVTGLLRESDLGVHRLVYSRWEWGKMAMPEGVLRRYADYLKEKGVLTVDQVRFFVDRMNEIYRGR